MLGKTEVVINTGESRDTRKLKTRHRTQTNKTKQKTQQKKLKQWATGTQVFV